MKEIKEKIREIFNTVLYEYKTPKDDIVCIIWFGVVWFGLTLLLFVGLWK